MNGQEAGRLYDNLKLKCKHVRNNVLFVARFNMRDGKRGNFDQLRFENVKQYLTFCSEIFKILKTICTLYFEGLEREIYRFFNFLNMLIVPVFLFFMVGTQ